MPETIQTDPQFESLKKKVQELIGFNSFQYKDSYLGRRFNARMRLLHIPSYKAYIEYLKDHTDEREHLRKDLTINVTEFFRDQPVYQVFQDEVFPQIMQQSSPRIKIWSAGSSDGKEAYSIAMIAFRKLGEHKARKIVEILGSDIDDFCLDVATQGRYESKPGIHQLDIARQLQFISRPEQFFTVEGNWYVVKDALKSIVRFEHYDLISDEKKTKMNVIFCRNVVIYFTRELQEILYMKFYEALRPGGFFVMGKTETLVGPARDLFTPYNSKERIFVKPDK